MKIIKIPKKRLSKLFPSYYLPFPSTGLTLIELLVVFSLIAVLSGIGIVSFVTYSHSQQVNQTANNIKLLINQARFNALSAVKTNQDLSGNTISCGASSLGGYTINLLGNSQIELNQLCENVNPSRIKLMVLPSNLTFAGTTTCTQLHFSPLSSVTDGAPCNIILTGYSQTKTITIDSGGNISIQ